MFFSLYHQPKLLWHGILILATKRFIEIFYTILPSCICLKENIYTVIPVLFSTFNSYKIYCIMLDFIFKKLVISLDNNVLNDY